MNSEDLNRLANEFQTQIAPEVWEALLGWVFVDRLSNLILAAFGISVAFVAFLLSKYCYRKSELADGSEEEGWAFATCFLAGVTLIIGAFSLTSFIDPMNWIVFVNPEIAVMDEVLKRIGG